MRPPRERRTIVTRRAMLAGASSSVLAGCHWRRDSPSPTIEFSRVPQADPGGREKNDIIEGVVKGAKAGQRIVLYAKSGKWWVQPLVNHAFTELRPNGTWTNATHLGTDYAALLVQPGYHPKPSIDALPATDGEVLAVISASGAKKPPSPMIVFGGYEWRVRNAPSQRGGFNRYDPSNAWVDEKGAMHLRIQTTGQEWTSCEVALTRSLGYGTYRWVIRDTAGLEPNMIFGMFTYDYAGGDEGNREMDIEIRRTGNPPGNSAFYLIQPYYVAANVARFPIPEGTLTHSLRWERGRALFRTVRGWDKETQEHPVAEHAITSGVPSPGIESIRMNVYVNRSIGTPRNNAEVVIEHFEYLP
ncbi:MAG TPA: glycoside hydrolase family 16 protein [Bryobacteraceae bacterium]|nr:glycoside hydrolase family 16 protein [Bryobacteraceae bacterium]